jgi:hypothetical protein
MAVRARLIKPYKHQYKTKPWPVGRIIQGTTQFISDLIHDGYAEEYKGSYPPKKEDKMKIQLKQLK